MENFSNKTGRSAAINLPLAPMADVFIVMLILVLQTLSTGADALSGGTDIALPTAQAENEKTSQIRLAIAQGTVSVNETPVVTLSAYEFAPEDLDASGISLSLKRALEDGIAANETQKALTLWADKNVPYSTVRRTLDTVMSAGITNIQIAVVPQ